MLSSLLTQQKPLRFQLQLLLIVVDCSQSYMYILYTTYSTLESLRTGLCFWAVRLIAVPESEEERCLLYVSPRRSRRLAQTNAPHKAKVSLSDQTESSMELFLAQAKKELSIHQEERDVNSEISRDPFSD